jgi:hypothetical protein
MNAMKKIIFILISVLSLSAHASTSTEYESDCKYIDASKKLRFSGKCAMNFGIVGMAGKSVRYILTFPEGDEVVISVFRNGVATVNNVPAKSIRDRKRLMHIVTGSGEEYLFSSPPPDSM